jgi:hypothetical protein
LFNEQQQQILYRVHPSTFNSNTENIDSTDIQLLFHYILCIVSLKIDKTVNQIDNKKEMPITKPDNISIIPSRQPN